MKNNFAVSLHKIPKEKQNKLIADLVNKHSKLEKQKKDNIVLLKSLANIKSDYHAKTKDSLVEFARIKEAFIKDLIEKSKKKSILKWEQGIISNIIRSEFEKLFNSQRSYRSSDKEAFIRGCEAAFKHQQSKIGELQKRVDAALQLVNEMKGKRYPFSAYAD